MSFKGDLTQLPGGKVGVPSYQEGTFTPIIIGSTSGTGTYTVQEGFYTKIGSRVFFHLYVVWTAHTGTGNLLVSGLPFIAKNITNNFSNCAIWLSNISFIAHPQCYVSPNTNNIQIQNVSSGAASANIPIETAGNIMCSGSYITDA